MSNRYTNPVTVLRQEEAARKERARKLDAIKPPEGWWWEASPESSEPFSERLEFFMEDQALIAADTEQEARGEAAAASAGLSPDARAALVDTIRQAHPGIVTELLQGDTADEILASVAGARAAYDKVAGALTRRVPVAAGGSSGAAGVRGARTVDTSKMDPLQKISYGLSQRAK